MVTTLLARLQQDWSTATLAEPRPEVVDGQARRQDQFGYADGVLA